MKYSDLISFNPIEDVIQLTTADDANRAKEYVKSYVMSDTMAANLKSPVLDQLQMDEVVDNKGVLVVGNYGTGKSHLMSVISSIAKDADNLQYLQNKNFAKEMECIAGKFEVLRIEIGGVTMSLREILFGFIEDDFAARGIDFEVPDFDTVRDNKKLIRDMHNFLFGGGGWNAGYLTGVIYFPSLSVETSIIELLKERLKNVSKAFAEVPTGSEAIISTQSASMLENIPNDSIDYIFTDPPFGDNLMYSELNSIWESWLRVYTNNEPEAVMNRTQGKQLAFYQEAMTKCFSEFERILKPNRWMTVEFHNSKNAVWNSIQTSLNRAGFIIADVRTLNKNQGSFNQVKGASQAIKQDLVISAYKPKESFRKDFQLHAGSVDTAWDFVRQHLANIPVVVVKNDHIEVVAERQAYLLFDRMVAYHIMQGIPVPLDATDFYRGLDEKFLKRDNMYFLPDQVNEYDTARITTEVENIQFEMFVTNEKSAISWLYQQLDEQFCGPQTYAELQPKFMQEVKAVDKYEQMPELATILEENFLQDEKGRWYIPDVTKEGDLVKLREKNLWKEFEGYMNSKGKLKLFRSEAIRVGFSRLWKEKNYKAIVDIAERLPEQTIQEDSNLLMYYDISLGRV